MGGYVKLNYLLLDKIFSEFIVLVNKFGDLELLVVYMCCDG